MFSDCSRCGWVLVILVALAACRDRKDRAEGNAHGGRIPSGTGHDGVSGAGNGEPARPTGRVARLVNRIDALNPKLRKAIETLDRMSSGGKGLVPPDAKKLADELLDVVRDFPDSSQGLWEYFEKTAEFLDHYNRLLKKLPGIDEKELEGLARRYNAKALAHNSARLELELLVVPARVQDSRELDPLSYGHKVSRLGKSVSSRLSTWYRRWGGKADRGPMPDRDRTLAFRVGTLRLKGRCVAGLRRMERITCRAGERRCESLRKRAKAFADSVRACLRLWDGLGADVSPGAGRESLKKATEELRRAHNRMLELGAALPSMPR